MIKLSSSITIFLKMFFPIFWLVLFGSLTVALFVSTPANLDHSRPYFKYIWVAIFLGWTLVLYFTVYQLKRVEGNAEGLNVSTYFKHIFVPIQAIKAFDETGLGPFLLIKVTYNQATPFGKSSYFLASKKRFNMFVKLHAERLKSNLPTS